ncbi:MAG: TIGR03087 family PEP-CTERM/XrtA system glycosyltransferase [Burkholderiales bacterium]|nr:TIGR03087 family PEP-CTERM/XrtA system glycosyltransferase [Burkholderiales bacterium]
MDALLFLAHRIPFPPNKGDKIRSFHLLRHLGRRYRVFLGTFVDDPADAQHVDAVQALCAEAFVARIQPGASRIRSLSGLLNGEPLTLPYFRDQALDAWVDRVVAREAVSTAFVFSSAMAQYVTGRPQLRTVVDFVDVDSAKWDEYSTRRGWPLSALYRREGRRLLDYERRVCRSADAAIFVTEEEAELFRRRAPECAERLAVIGNGVDAEHFSPRLELPSPYAAGEKAIVFTGAMDYWPNADAAAWFAREVLPLVRREQPAARFYVVGMNPGAAVQALGRDGATVVTGRVADVRPYVRHARVAVVPLRVARGIQNKVLEAMAMGKPVVVTPACAASLEAVPGREIAVASDATAFARAVLELIDGARSAEMGTAARARVLASYSWDASLAGLDRLLDRIAGRPERRVPVRDSAAA